jgi:hypothetical protein
MRTANIIWINFLKNIFQNYKDFNRTANLQPNFIRLNLNKAYEIFIFMCTFGIYLFM